MSPEFHRSKILFAIRRNALVPWDDPIRKHYDSYLSYLYQIRSILQEIDAACWKNGFKLTELPSKLGRANSTVPKLIDEYNWITITQGYKLPKIDILQKWVSWDKK